MLSRLARSHSLLARASAHAQLQRGLATMVLSDPLLPDGSVPASTCSAVTAAQQLGEKEIVLVVVGDAAPLQVPQTVSKIVHASTSRPTAETIAAVVQSLASSNNSDVILGTSTKYGATSIPRIAALLNAAPVTDVTAIESYENGTLTGSRPMYAGSVLTRIQATTRVLSVRPTSFEKMPLMEANAVTTESIPVAAPFADSQWVADHSSVSDRPDLGSANIVVSGGRGMKEGANFTILETLVDALGGGAVGASRAAVDAGMVPNDMQVGQTGKVVAPNLYVAVGISGAIQHLSGMKDSKTIVAINKDPEAPIFQVADYGLVADLFTAVPEMSGKL